MNNLISFVTNRWRLLAFILVAILVTIFIALNLNKKQVSTIPSVEVTPTSSEPTIMVPTEIIYSPYPTLTENLKEELQYPVDYQGITVEFRPKSGTFLIYYDEELSQAETKFQSYLNSLGLVKENYRNEFRSLKNDPLPPAYSQDTTN